MLIAKPNLKVLYKKYGDDIDTYVSLIQTLTQSDNKWLQYKIDVFFENENNNTTFVIQYEDIIITENNT